MALCCACAQKAAKAGVDVIEIHGDRIVGSLTSTILNKRTDEYGGSFENDSLLVSNKIELSTPLAHQVLKSISDYDYDEDGDIYIFDIQILQL